MEPTPIPPADALPQAAPPAPIAAPAAAPPPARRRFSWRDFFIGVVAGMILTVVGAVLLIAGLAIVGSRLAGDGQDLAMELPAPDVPAATHAQRPVYGSADVTWTVHALDGTPATLGQYRGKVVFLNFWATWCGPCVAELPAIQKLHEALKDNPVAFVLVSEEDAPTLKAFLAKKPVSLPVFRSDGHTPPLFASSAIPTTFIIDPDGLVVFKRVGAAQWDQATAETFIRGLLGATPAAGAGR